MSPHECVTYPRVQVSVVRSPCWRYRTMKDVRSADHVAELCRAALKGDPREHMMAVYLDGRHRMLALHIVSIGTANVAPMHPREFFAPAMAMSATAVVACHNHPSGDPKPSEEDRAVTERLRSAGELLGIEVLDHVVLGTDRYWSFADESFHPMQEPL